MAVKCEVLFGSMRLARGMLLVLLPLLSCAQPKSVNDEQSVNDERVACLKRMQFIHERLAVYAGFHSGFPAPSRSDIHQQGLYSWRFTVITETSNSFGPLPESPWPKDSIYELWDTREFRGLFSARGFDILGVPNPKGQTDFFALYGPRTAFTEYNEDNDIPVSEMEPDAILMVEGVRDIHWIEAGDINIASLQKSKSRIGLGDLKGNYPDCFAVVFVDGTAWFLKNSTPFDKISKFIAVESAMRFDREAELGDYIVQRLEPRESVQRIKEKQPPRTGETPSDDGPDA